MPDYEINKDKVSWRRVNGEIIIIHLETTNYYSINKTGSIIWEMLSQQPSSEEEIIERVSKQYSVDSKTTGKDVQLYLRTMLEEDLIQEGGSS
jgi:uncharacterized lipoprotein